MAMSWQKNNSLAHLDFLLRIFLSFGKLFIKAKQKLFSVFPTLFELALRAASQSKCEAPLRNEVHK